MQTSENSDFMKTVEEIKLSEERAEKIKVDAKEKAEQIMKKGKESVLKIKLETNDETVKVKNKHLKGGEETIETEIKAIVEKARHEGDALKKKRLKKEELLSILKEFTGTL